MRSHIRRLLESAGFSPRQLFAALQGAWLEPKQGYIWQENTGVTPTTTGGQTIGLMLDQSQGAVLGPEIIVPASGPYVSAPSGVVAGGAGSVLSIETGSVRHTAPGASASRLEITFAGVAGKQYRIQATLNSNFGIVPTAWVNTSPTNFTTLPSGAATLGVYVQCNTTATVTLRCYPRSATSAQVAGDYVEFSAFSVREVLSGIAHQATAANRPAYQLDSNNLPLARFDTNDSLTVSLPSINVRRNLLTSTTGPFNNLTAGGWLYETGLPDPLGIP